MGITFSDSSFTLSLSHCLLFSHTSLCSICMLSQHSLPVSFICAEWIFPVFFMRQLKWLTALKCLAWTLDVESFCASFLLTLANELNSWILWMKHFEHFESVMNGMQWIFVWNSLMRWNDIFLLIFKFLFKVNQCWNHFFLSINTHWSPNFDENHNTGCNVTHRLTESRWISCWKHQNC